MIKKSMFLLILLIAGALGQLYGQRAYLPPKGVKKSPQASAVNKHKKPAQNLLVTSVELLPIPAQGLLLGGVEWKLNKIRGLGICGGISIGHSDPFGFSGGKLTRTAYKIKPFYRWYWHQNKKKSLFLELNAAFYHEAFTRANDWYHNGDFYFQYGAARATKNVYGVNLVIGKRIRPFNRLSIDFYGGVGAKLEDIHYQATEIELINKPLLGGLMSRADRTAGRSGLPNISAGVRLNFVLTQK